MPQPFLDDDTRPIRVPVAVQAVRTCRPVLTRITAPGIGETFPVPATGELVLGRGQAATVRVDDEAVSRRHARVALGPGGTVVLVDLASRNGTIVNGRPVQEAILVDGDKIQIGTSAVFRFSLNDRLDENYLDHLYQTSMRDPLTSLLNRRYLMECLERDLSLARRHRLPMALLLADADKFKDVNDSHGHSGGDAVLKSLASLLAGMQRRESILARYGGEEFAVFLRNVDQAGAEVFAERMRATVAAGSFRVGETEVKLTMSVGLAVTTTDGVEDPVGLVDAADRYLYLSKTRGRNCVTSATTFKA